MELAVGVFCSFLLGLLIGKNVGYYYGLIDRLNILQQVITNKEGDRNGRSANNRT